MPYTYEQRKLPQGPQNTEPERTNAPVPGFSAPNPGASIPPTGPSFDLGAAMRERMVNTFGDLSAVRDYAPSVREQAPLQAEPYTGPVTRAVSNASPSPAAAGPMQASRGGRRQPQFIPDASSDADDSRSFIEDDEVSGLSNSSESKIFGDQDDGLDDNPLPMLKDTRVRPLKMKKKMVAVLEIKSGRTGTAKNLRQIIPA